MGIFQSDLGGGYVDSELGALIMIVGMVGLVSTLAVKVVEWLDRWGIGPSDDDPDGLA